MIAKNEQRLIGFSSDDSGFDPERHRGRAVVTTMHKAKGLEWGRVHLMSVNNYDFPSNMPAMRDRFIFERSFERSGVSIRRRWSRRKQSRPCRLLNHQQLTAER